MKPVVAPLAAGMSGEIVANLHVGLTLLFGEQPPVPGSEAEQIKYQRAFARERQLKAYGRGTAAIVAAFQQRNRLRASGDIDVLSATRLNALLEAAGHLPPTTPGGPTTTRSVTGIARTASGTPAAGVTLTLHTLAVGGGTTTHSAAVDGDSRFAFHGLPTTPGLQIRLQAGALDLIRPKVVGLEVEPIKSDRPGHPRTSGEGRVRASEG